MIRRLFKNPKTMDILVLSIRLLLAFIFLSYGLGKLTDGQFGNLTDEELNTPIQDLSLMKVAWFLFDHQPFEYFIGISQIIASLLLLYRKTVILGALMLIPIISNILIIDLTIMHYGFKVAFFFRLVGYLCYIGLIFYHYRADLIPIWYQLLKIKTVKFPLRKLDYLWAVLIVPLLEIAPGIIQYLYLIVTHPTHVYNSILRLFQ